MTVYTTTLTSYRGFQDIGTVGQTVAQLSGNVQSINQLLDVGVGNTADVKHMFVRVEHLLGLGLATLINGNQLTSPGAGGSGGSSTVNVTDSITGAGSVASPLQLSGDVGSPGNDYFYGTNGSGVKGFYALSSYSGTVTSVGLSDTSTTAIYTVSGSPVTTSGTIDITLNTQTANRVFAGPTTGSAAQPTFRALVAADLPIGVADSIAVVSSNYQLSGDSASPGNSFYYGTNGSGTKGWYALPGGYTPGTVQINMSAGWNSSSGAVQLSLTVPQDLIIPFTCTLREVDIVTQGGTGSCTVTLWKAGSLALPNSGNDMTGGTPPAISSGTVYNNTTLTGWTTSLTQNDRILCTLSANSTFTSVKIILRMY